MKGEEQQADRGENGWKSRLREGGREQQGRPRRQGALFVGRKTLWKESVKGAKFWVAELQEAGSKVLFVLAKRST